MPRISLWERSRTYKATNALIEIPFLPVLLPCSSHTSFPARKYAWSRSPRNYEYQCPSAGEVERHLLSALARAGSCRQRRYPDSPCTYYAQRKTGASYRHPPRRCFSTGRSTNVQPESERVISVTPKRSETGSGSDEERSSSEVKHDDWRGTGADREDSFFKPFYQEVDHKSESTEQDASKARKENLQAQLERLEKRPSGTEAERAAYEELQHLIESEDSGDLHAEVSGEELPESTEQELAEQVRYLRTVRELETKLENARHKLHSSMKKSKTKPKRPYRQEGASEDQQHVEVMNVAELDMAQLSKPSVRLKKEDFLGLVDLYFYSHRTRFLSESPDASPTPVQLDDYSFKISEDFSPPTNSNCDLVRDDEGTPVSPLYHIEVEIKARKMNEIKVLQSFVDLLLDDYSPLRDLFGAYKALPQPGVSYLSGGVLRLFLQRMSTPWRTSQKAMLRYMSLLDDMQLAGLPITAWEWSSAIHLAGQSFSNVSNTDVSAAFRVWRQMEKEAGVAARAVTFNILFDVAVKAGKFVLAEEVLKEMHDRGFRLNRLGRVSLIYYYGKKGDGDGVRKAYRDFVEAGEIVDTLVLNCVMASLVNAQEPAAAEQIYERMKGLQERLRRGTNNEGEEALFLKYPPPGPDKIGRELASNALGRVLLNASRLKTVLPEHHTELQNVMPLTPDAVTYRILMSHHAKTSGNIDRLTVLLDDMTREFRIPIAPLTFQILFRGFAMHGGSDRSDAKWTRERLQIAWAACVVCMKAGKTKEASPSQKVTRSELPSLEDAEAMAADEERRANEEAHKRPKLRRPTAWATFIKQFATPYPDTKPFDLYSTSRDASMPAADNAREPEEEYRMPPVALTPRNGSSEHPADLMNAIKPSQGLVLWVIRAYARCTSDRSMLEDVWYQLTRLWRPFDDSEKAVAIRELRRALRYCDTHGRK